MASILDSGLTSIFSSIFVFLLVYAVVWGVLSKLNWFGKENKGSYAIIALCVALLMAIASPARTFVSFIAPWYLALALVLFFIMFIMALFGLDAGKDFPNIIKDSRVHTWIIILSVIILIAGLAFTFGQTALDTTQGTTPGTTIEPGTTVIGPGTTPGTTGPVGPQPGTPGSTATSSFQTNFVNTLLHPKVLGLFITFLVAAVSIYFLSSG